jgi:hypothetical protein
MEALKMEREMTHWNDDRLDELNGRMKDGFAKVDERFDKVDKRFENVATREDFAEVKIELNRVNERLDRVMYTLMATGVGLVGTVAVGILGLILKG